MGYEQDSNQEQETSRNINDQATASSKSTLSTQEILAAYMSNGATTTPVEGSEQLEQQLTTPETSSSTPNNPLPPLVHDSSPTLPTTPLDVAGLLKQMRPAEETERTSVDVNQLLTNFSSAAAPSDNDPTLYEESVSFEALQEGVDYVVLQRGETLTTIATARPAITVEQVRAWNPKAAANTRNLPTGIRILISGSAKNLGERINTMGRIMGPEGQDVRMYQTASTATPTNTVRYGASIYLEKTDVSGSWYYISVDGNKGWVEKNYVTTNIPISDPEAELYYVTSGQNLEGILKAKGYPSDKETSYWHYARAATLLNPTAFNFNGAKAQAFVEEQNSSARGVVKQYIDADFASQLIYNSIELQPTYHIWLPSTGYTERAKASGAIESRSDLMQGVIDVAEGVESFLQGAREGFTGRIEEELSAMKGMLEQLAAFAKDILGSAQAILMDFWNYIQQFSIEQFLQELLEGLIDPTLKMHLTNAWGSLDSQEVERQARLWGKVGGAAMALGAILAITRGGGKMLKVLKKLSPSLGGLLDKKRAIQLSDGSTINVREKDLFGDRDDSRMKMDGKNGDEKQKNEDKVTKTNTVWDDIVTTQSPYKNSVLPKSFELQSKNGMSLWVHPNATKHIAEYVAMKAENHAPNVVKLATQQQLRSLQAAINDIATKGIIYDKIIVVDNWELKFGKPRQEGQLPVLFHALPIK